MKISKEQVVDLFFCFVLYLSTGAMEVFTVGRGGGSSADSGGSPLMKVLWAGVYLVVIALMLPRRRQIVDLLLRNKAFVGLVLLAVFSYRWSIDPKTTMARSVPLLLSALVGLEFARRYTTSEQLKMLWKVLALIMVLGTIAELFFPNLFPKSGQEDEMALTAWHGIVTTKNTWARLIVLGGVVALSRRPPTRRGTFYTVFLMVLIYGLLAASRSTGGVIVMLFATVLSFLFPVLRWRRRKPLVLLCIAMPAILISGALILIQNFLAIMKALGKDPTMTGRLPIWSNSLHFGYMKPLLGYGYAAFWGVDSRPARLIREATHWDTLPHAHNGYIDLFLSLGLVGMLLYLGSNAVGLWRAASYVRHTKGQESTWPIAFLCVVFLYQINEATIVAGNQLVWVLFSSVLFSLAIESSALAPIQVVDEVSEEASLLAGD